MPPNALQPYSWRRRRALTLPDQINRTLTANGAQIRIAISQSLDRLWLHGVACKIKSLEHMRGAEAVKKFDSTRFDALSKRYLLKKGSCLLRHEIRCDAANVVEFVRSTMMRLMLC